MSASLVGSEMCIRDRQWPAGPVGDPVADCAPSFWKGGRCAGGLHGGNQHPRRAGQELAAERSRRREL
eukprot:11579231-Alexandrium_andersonii.AAC.1